MNVALLFLALGPAPDVSVPPRVAEAEPAAAVTTYDAFVATEETLPVEDLKHPAIFTREGRTKAIDAPMVSGSIA